MVKLDDNSIGIIGESIDGEVVKYVSKDYGESWKKDKINLINTTNKELVVNSMIYLNNGNIMISYSIMKPMIEIEDEIKDKSEKEIEEFFEQCYRNSEKKYVLVNENNIIEEIDISLEKSNDKIYTFPVSIKYPILVGPRDEIQKIDNFDSFVEVVKELSNNTNRPIMEKSYNEKEFICSLYNSYGNDWIRNDDTIDKDNLSNFLKKLKELYIAIEKQNKEYYRKNGEVIQEYTEIGEKDEENYFDIEYYLNSLLFIEAFPMKDVPVFKYGCLNNIWDYSSLITILYQNNEIDYKILNKEVGGVFSSNLLMGINSKSKNKEKAKKILEKFISTDINNSNMFSGYNTNKEYISKQLNKYLDYVEPIYDEKINHYTIQGDNKENEYIMVFPNDDDINALINEIEGIKKTAIVDKRIILEVAKVFENYVKDKYSLNEGIDIIVDNLELYLAE